jgi:hypothetical protein
VPDHIRKAAQRASEAASLRAAHEAAVGGERAADAGLLAAYLAYVKLEQEQADPARVQASRGPRGSAGDWVDWARWEARSRRASSSPIGRAQRIGRSPHNANSMPA